MGVFRDWFEQSFDRFIRTPVELVAARLKGIETPLDGIKLALDTGLKLATAPLLLPIKALETVIKEFKNELRGDIAKGAEDVLDVVAAAGKSVVRVPLTKMMDGLRMPKEVKDVINGWFEHKGELGAQIPDIMIGYYLSGLLSAVSEPIFYQISTEARELLRFQNPSISEAFSMFYKGSIDSKELDRIIKEAGFNDKLMEGYKEIFKFHPTPSDLVMWQAREVYEPAMIEKYGLTEELEGVTKEPFYKAGMSDEDIKNFWVAHWQHPPWTVIQRMLFRTDLTEEDVWDWFKTIEIPPFWRDKYIEIAYNPVTRVDLRRLYQDAIITREEVVEGYIKLGNNPEVAEQLTQWTEKRYSPEELDTTKGEILRQYSIGEIEKGEAEKLLKEIDISDLRIEWLIGYEDYKLRQKSKEEEAEALVLDTVNGIKTIDQLETALKELGLSIKSQRRYTKKAVSEIRAKVAIPAKADLKTWFTLEIITEKVYREKMSGLKYRKEDIDNYVKEVKGEK